MEHLLSTSFFTTGDAFAAGTYLTLTVNLCLYALSVTAPGASARSRQVPLFLALNAWLETAQTPAGFADQVSF